MRTKPDPAETIACYPAKPYFRNVGIVCTIGFALMGISSVLVAYFNVDKSFARPLHTAAIFGVFWSCFIGLGCWLILFSRRYRLYVDGESIRQVGVVADRVISFSLVNEMTWRRFPAGGSVRLATQTAVMKIDFGNIGSEDRKQLISMLRGRLGDCHQFGWCEFQRQFEDSPERRGRTRRTTRVLISVFWIHAIAFSVLWGLGFGNQFLFASIVNAVVAIYLVRRGVSENQRERSDPTNLTDSVIRTGV